MATAAASAGRCPGGPGPAGEPPSDEPADPPEGHQGFEGTPAQGLAMVGSPRGSGARRTPVCAG